MTTTKPTILSKDKERIQSMGLSVDQIKNQMEKIKNGTPFVCLKSPAICDKGINQIADNEQDILSNLFQAAIETGRVTRLVPASGAATRMCKNLAVVTHHKTGKDAESGLYVLEHVKNLPFYNHLKDLMLKKNRDLDGMLAEKRFSEIVPFIITDKGLNYNHLPKALIPFHRYESHARTPLAEHLSESRFICRDHDGHIRIHFTTSQAHQVLMERSARRFAALYAKQGAFFEISFSCQKPSTDTVALDDQNELVRDQEGHLVFRPGGHGALIENLNDLKADIILIKNIDNVSYEHMQKKRCYTDKVLGGFLVELQKEIFYFLLRCDQDGVSEDDCRTMTTFVKERLKIDLDPSFEKKSCDERAKILYQKLHRPLRVCAMVSNEGEPGGGPFWVQDKDGASLQIVESAQVDKNNTKQKKIFDASTHFNPVILACGLRDYRGKNFNLLKYVDQQAYFVSHKSYEGRKIRVLEWPGLWNGAMADWISVFIEVSPENFSPVKTLKDLLREEHQPPQ